MIFVSSESEPGGKGRFISQANCGETAENRNSSEVKTMEISGAQIAAEILREQGTDTVFGYPGGQVTDLFDALYGQDDIRLILTAHEQGAAHAADGYARASGRVGVVLATSGPGATNLITGIAAAYLDSVPVVAITGNVPCSQIGKDSFQEVDIVGVSMPVTKHNFIVKDVGELADTLREAFRIAKSGRPGPVLVDIPQDVQKAVCIYEPEECVSAEPLRLASNHRLRWAADMIQHAKRPYIYFGGGIISADASEELTAFAAKIDAPMGCSLMGLSAVPSSHPRFLGMQGMHGHYASTLAEDEADLLLAFGVRFSDRATGEQSRFSEHFSVIHIDIDGAELNKNVTAKLTVRGDIKDALRRLTALVPQQMHPEWTARIAELRAEEARRTSRSHNFMAGGGYLTHYEIIDAVSAAAEPDAVIVTDVGQHQMWTAQRYPLKQPRTFLTSGGLGAMGYGMGAAIGAFAATGKRCVLFTGDGSFGMNLNELATAVSFGVNLVVIIMNNGVLGMVRQWQKLFFDGRYAGTTLNRKTDFVKVAEAFGAEGMRAQNPDELQNAVCAAFSKRGVFVIDCRMNPDEPVLPMRPPGGSVDDMITELEP